MPERPAPMITASKWYIEMGKRPLRLRVDCATKWAEMRVYFSGEIRECNAGCIGPSSGKERPPQDDKLVEDGGKSWMTKTGFRQSQWSIGCWHAADAGGG